MNPRRLTCYCAILWSLCFCTPVLAGPLRHLFHGLHGHFHGHVHVPLIRHRLVHYRPAYYFPVHVPRVYCSYYVTPRYYYYPVYRSYYSCGYPSVSGYWNYGGYGIYGARTAPPVNYPLASVSVPTRSLAVSRPFAENRFVANPATATGAEAALSVPTEASRMTAPVVPVSRSTRLDDAGNLFLSSGDRFFRANQYEEAAAQYKLAGMLSPTSAAARIRNAIALAATGHYQTAVESVRQAVKLKHAFTEDRFHLDEVYKPGSSQKQLHLDRLAKAALQQPTEPDPLFLIGVLLHFDGQRQRAEKFFRRAEQLTDGDVNHVRAFLAADDEPFRTAKR